MDVNAGSSTEDDPLREARALVESATRAGVTLRVTGGIAVAMQCPSASREPLRRRYKDLDVVGLGPQREAIDALMKSLGMVANEEFNSLHGRHQLMYMDQGGRILDVFIDHIVMCHVLDVSRRLDLDDATLSPADLLLSKLQVIEVNESDLKDSVALLADCDVDAGRVADVLASDWGWWRTVTSSLDKVRQYNAALQGFESRDRVDGRLAALQERIEAAPKGRKWKLRARVGDRVRWYQTPEEELET